jgi:IclR family transcriptional regulator, KDG regulon repressor
MIVEMMALDNCGYTISEVARRCKMPVSTANVLLYTLQETGYVQRSEDRSFSLTWKLFTEGNRLVSQVKPYELVLPELERLSEITDLTIDFAIPDQYELIYVHVIQGRGDIQIQARVGQRRLLHQSAAGKAMLAFFSQECVKDFAEATGLPAVTSHTIASHGALVKELAQIQRQGYAADNEESGRGLWGVAVPVFDYRGAVVGALGVAGTTLGSSQNTKRLIQEIRKSALIVSRRLGYVGNAAARGFIQSGSRKIVGSPR